MEYKKQNVIEYIGTTMQRCVEEGRLQYYPDGRMIYTTKQGETSNIDFDGMADVFIKAAGGVTQLARDGGYKVDDVGGMGWLAMAGITRDDLKNAIAVEYEKAVK